MKILTKPIEVKIKIIINNNLYKKNIIDKQTYSAINELLLKNGR